MALRIGADHSRFRDIVKGKVRQNLHKYISNDEMTGKVGKDTVSIPIPQIDLPKFRYGNGAGGVGQGSGEIGNPIGGEDGQEGEGRGKAGKDAGEHPMEVDVSLDELAEILGDELELPAIENKGKDSIESESTRYTSIRRVGPNSLRHMRRTYRETLKRAVSSGTYDPKNPSTMIPIREDWRYRSGDVSYLPVANAVIIYMMDVSGSMGDEQKGIVRTESFWIDLWLRKHYKGVQTRYIIHDVEAREVDRETFFRTREAGGTAISSAYRLCRDLLDKEYPTSEWNIYPFHFSDGDNWSMDDSTACFDLIRGMLPRVNQFCYGQVTSPYGSGQFLKDLQEAFPGEERLVTSEIADRGGILGSIKEFLGKGR